MTENKKSFNRRQVLKVAGISGISSVGLSGFTDPSEAHPSESVNVIEANVFIDEPQDQSAAYLDMDVGKKYHVTSNSQLEFTSQTSEHDKKLIRNRGFVTFVNDLISDPAPILKPIEYHQFPVSLRSQYRTSKSVIFSEPIVGEIVQVVAKRNEPRLKIKNEMHDLPIGTEKIFNLSSREAQIKTKKLTNDVADKPEIPESQRSLVVEERSVNETITPKIKIKNRGEMKINSD
ncbi:hypothetical protein [Halosimplex halobium]|uniref:hypothetical protein n=1 Tax=Halosimplex halobium TaxID=3396618 RepID=UPI003F54B826